jgi:tRNA (cmo5U34)-methyltransferase
VTFPVDERSNGWEEENSTEFIELGDVITPSRQEQVELVVSLVPAEASDQFSVVDLACGAGSLTEAVLRRFPESRVLALDGSPTMRDRASQRLSMYAGRVQFADFDLRDRDWLERIPKDVRCFVSSLAIHHLDGGEKQTLFRDLAAALPRGGGIFIVDLVEPVNRRAWTAYGDAWDAIVQHQSLEQTGSPALYQRFRDGWNHYRDPDVEFDQPSGLFEQLCWLADAGLSQVDCFWLRAGHAIYGGYK